MKAKSKEGDSKFCKPTKIIQADKFQLPIGLKTRH